jgi:hypothetical protein
MTGIAIAFMIIALAVEMGILGYCLYVQVKGNKKAEN